MNKGIYISGIGHIGLIVWVLVGGLFSSDRTEPLDVAEVSIISGEEFAALTAPASAPRATQDTQEPTPPASEQPVTPTPTPDTTPETPARPDVSQPEQPDAAPDVSEIEPLPQAEVTDEAPTPPAPPTEDNGTTLLTQSTRPRPAPRVAPVPAAQPTPDAEVSDTVTEATVPTPEPEPEVVKPPVETATAPEEATTEIVTEAEEKPDAETSLTSSMRPRSRPARPTKPAPSTQKAAKPADVQSSVNDALAEALGGGATETSGNGSAPVGPPMTSGEKDALRIGVQRCWVVDAGSEAGRITVTVAMSLTEDGKVAGNSIKMIANSGGSDQAVNSAFQSARRAILRCQQNGYDLPKEKYAQWRDVEMTFNPEKMRIK
ncbi:hypothetical protein [Actibacterium lipolyticum]|nr:hypothetical protein [Actibacterium lipolyticum]